jgi:hypothetical protein
MNDVQDDLADHEDRIVALEASSGLLATQMSDAQFKALPSTDLDIAPLVSGSVLMPKRLMIFANIVSGYSNLSAESYIVGTINGDEVTGYLGKTTASGLDTIVVQLTELLQTGRHRYVIPGEFEQDNGAAGNWGLLGTVWPYAGHISQPLKLSMSNPAGDLTGGSPSNQFLIVAEFGSVEVP